MSQSATGSETRVAVLVDCDNTTPEILEPAVKRRPKSLIAAVALLAGDTSEGKVGLGELGQYLKRTDPAFSPKAYGHSGLLDMVATYTDLTLVKVDGGHWVSIKAKPEAPGAADH